SSTDSSETAMYSPIVTVSRTTARCASSWPSAAPSTGVSVVLTSTSLSAGGTRADLGRAHRRSRRSPPPPRSARSGWTAADLQTWLDDDARRATLLRLLAAVESEPSTLGASPHLLTAARTPR